MGVSELAYGVYERRLVRRLDPSRLPHHVGAIVDGNRRWAKGAGTRFENGYQAGADKISEFAQWCDDLGVEIVTLWLLSTDNLQRSPEEVGSILAAVEGLMEKLGTTTKGITYDVAASCYGPTCECGDWVWRRDGLDPTGCKHIAALRAVGLLR